MEADAKRSTSAVGAININVLAGTDLVSNAAVTAGTNSLTFTLDLANYRGAVISIYNTNGTTDTPFAMSLPRVASNKYTRYEAYIEITESTKITYAGFKQFSITASTLATATIGLLFANVRLITLNPSFNAGTTSGNTYHVDITFDTAYSNTLGSGLSVNDAYPVTGNGITVTGVLSANKTIRLDEISSWVNGTVHRVFTAVETVSSGTDEADITLYFLLDSDPTEK
jgi:hypothetical protein